MTCILASMTFMCAPFCCLISFTVSLSTVVHPAADDDDVASSRIEKAILHSFPTDLLRKAPRAVRLLTSFSLFLVICMGCVLC